MGGVRSTSQVANNFMGTGLKFDVTFEENTPAKLKLVVPIFDPPPECMAELEATEVRVTPGFEPAGLTPAG